MFANQVEDLKNRILAVDDPERIILFGSHAAGCATESSDVDLLVVTRSALSRHKREVLLTRKLFGSGIAFDLLVLTPAEMEERIRLNGPFFREILAHGKTIYERS